MKRYFIFVILLLVMFSSLAYAEVQKEYYENGTLKAEYNVEYGKRNGEFKLKALIKMMRRTER